ncbi:LytR/AlgR family response regulator transcription factor [Mucilaginibacter ginkgonis]|uniref:Response regulator transcription factor n=1 Tax=Mucilaginibacter ginkgonis TaxID=2682091 RepID=A0A6I4INN5_9SPHI|nr:LytTR family DNA-binding domain-containing protein [Mucilaginibacter ginkgonis]QQL48903.1 response regulator transcription factor [Mucilaginibacter ginkgonis]
MNCFIIDDEPYSIDTLSSYIQETSSLTLVGSSSSAVDGMSKVLNAGDVDLVFLDVDMPTLSGIEIAKLLPQNISVIFCTAHARYAVKAFDVQAQDFLLKPVSFPRFLQAVNKVMASRHNVHQGNIDFQADALFINPGVKGKFVQITLHNILYIEGLKNYVLIHTNDGKNFITYLTMSEIQRSLTDKGFLRIHKSYIINKSKIVAIEGNTVKIEHDIDLPIGTTYREFFLQEITKFTLQSKRKN